ncbi:MAG: MucR family transcriptional regulator [Gordonia sp. (in: high G+C Gram-positive bacteria)]
MTETPDHSQFGVLGSDDTRLQCHECGDWFVNLGAHVVHAHGIPTDDYRETWGLSPLTRLCGPAHRARVRARVLHHHAVNPEAAAAGQMLPRTGDIPDGPERIPYEELAERFWPERLSAAGWDSWSDAVEWAEEHDASWNAIAERIGGTGQNAKHVAANEGVFLRSPSQRMLDAAAAHVARNGTLLDAQYELASWLGAARHRRDETPFSRAVSRELSQLDPDWHLDWASRRRARAERGIRGTRINDRALALDAVRAAGFDSAPDMLCWAITNHLGSTELGERLGCRGDHAVRRLTVAHDGDPTIAVRELIESRPGFLADDGRRMQCHECGLWQIGLITHIRVHDDEDGEPLTPETYRLRHRLPPDTSLYGKSEVYQERWLARLDAAGFGSWNDALVLAARKHLGFHELAALLDCNPASIWPAVTDAQPDGSFAATAPYRLSVEGVLYDDGDRVQCHDCGLWFTALYEHVDRHTDGDVPLTAERYRVRHGLAPETALRSVFTRHLEQWQLTLERAGFASTDEMLIHGARHRLGTPAMAELLGVARDTVARHVIAASPADPWTATTPYRESRPGVLIEHQGKLQCHECGWWFPSLRPHIPTHRVSGVPLTPHEYLARHRLPADTKLNATPPPRANPLTEGARQAGFSTWAELVQHGARQHIGLAELSELIGLGVQSLQNRLKREFPEDVWPTLPETLESRPGHLALDQGRLQCHICGLWSYGLTSHVTAHIDPDGQGFTSATYRAHFGLAPSTRMKYDPPTDQIATDAVSVPGRLAEHRGRLQCHECGEWYTALDSHVRSTHGLTARDYRTKWHLDPRTPMKGPEDPAVWADRLAAAGWTSWNEAAAWAATNECGWHDIAERLGASTSAAWSAARRQGVTLDRPADRMLRRAEQHVAEHYTLLNARGDLARWLTNLRAAASKGYSTDVVERLDELDPDWRLPRKERDAAGRSRNVQDRRATAAYERMQSRLTAAGFDDAVALLQWAIEEHLGTPELGRKLGLPSNSVLRRLIAGNPVHPLDATEHLRSSVPGHLEDDGKRVQCHDCGLWFVQLSRHIPNHLDADGASLTPEGYRKRHGLRPETSLSTGRRKPAPPRSPAP